MARPSSSRARRIGLVALHGANVVPVSTLGLHAQRVTRGHRFLGRAEIELATAEAYAPTLAAEGKVMVSFGERRAKIVAGLEAAAAGARVIMPDALLDEVTALVEWPKVYTGGFDAAFLDVPQECLILTMQRNQRYFALADAGWQLQSRFLHGQQHRDPRPGGNHPRQRARAARAACGRQVLLRPGPQADRWRRASTGSPACVYHNKLGTMARATGSTALSVVADREHARAPTRRWRTARRCSRRPIS